jgi:hypothetical protein
MHRVNIGDFSEAALFHWITNDDELSLSSLHNVDFVQSTMSTTCEALLQTLYFNYGRFKSMLVEESNFVGKLLCNPLAIGTIFRLLRFLSDDRKDKWVSILLSLTTSSRKCLSTLASLPEWQPCLFHLISDSLELVRTCMTSSDAATEASDTHAKSLIRLDLYLQLYSTLLGHLFRSGGDKVR